MSQSNQAVITQIGDLTVADFLSEYWQKKPLFVKNAFPNIYAIPPEELAGFSLEEEVESRLISESPEPHKPFTSQWQVQHGPLAESDFAKTPKSHWTLLVQAVNQLDPNLHKFLNTFRFIPNWRLDDLMVSYAEKGGSVGPHFDYYDVFLVQAHGRRHWRIGQHCDAHTPLQENQPLKLLTEFNTTEEFVVESGDLLYIPPGIAHWGIAEEACTTYSVGFRAPSYSEALLDFNQDCASEFFEHQRLTDNIEQSRSNPGEITRDDILQFKKILQDLAEDEEKLINWFGRTMTEPKRSQICFDAEDQNTLQLSPSTRAAFYNKQSQCALFLNGELFHCSILLAQSLCAHTPINPKLFLEEQELIQEWLEKDYLISCFHK